MANAKIIILTDRLEKLYRLVDYLKQRALYYYSWTSDSKFKQMSSIYGISISVADISKRVRPIIDVKNVDEHITIPLTRSELEETNKKQVHHKKNSPSKKPQAPAILAKMEIGRNLKSMGMPVEQIMLATGLTKDEINRL